MEIARPILKPYDKDKFELDKWGKCASHSLEYISSVSFGCACKLYHKIRYGV